MCKIADWMVFALLAICSVSDWKKKTIPIIFLIMLSVVVAVFAILCHDGVSMRLRVSGAFIGLLFLLISKCTKEAIGYGDSWLILLLGIHMGSLRAVSVLFVASMLAGVASLFFLWKRGWKKHATLPFVPFLSISYLGAILL